MRCDEVSRELSAPTGRLDPSAVSAHLEDCSVCAEWANRVRQLDTLWDATRPAEPAPAAFEAVWAGVSAQVDEPVVIPLPSRSAFGRRLALGLISAAAACLVLALWMGRHQDAGPGADPGTQVAQNSPVEPEQPATSQAEDLALALIALEQGPTPIIHLSGDAVTVESQPLSDVSDTVTVAAEIDILNYFETLGL
ncbi:MAG TPA: hypothetical protein VFT74_17075 [Isosphaeraceae bacterium]|nr:hypothetical protein [Isosphaeraceae bacterium]